MEPTESELLPGETGGLAPECGWRQRQRPSRLPSQHARPGHTPSAFGPRCPHSQEGGWAQISMPRAQVSQKQTQRGSLPPPSGPGPRCGHGSQEWQEAGKGFWLPGPHP